MCTAPKVDIPDPPTPQADKKNPLDIDAAVDRKRKKLTGGFGSGQTVLTSPLGLSGTATTSKTLLGQ